MLPRRGLASLASAEGRSKSSGAIAAKHLLQLHRDSRTQNLRGLTLLRRQVTSAGTLFSSARGAVRWWKRPLRAMSMASCIRITFLRFLLVICSFSVPSQNSTLAHGDAGVFPHPSVSKIMEVWEIWNEDTSFGCGGFIMFSRLILWRLFCSFAFLTVPET